MTVELDVISLPQPPLLYEQVLDGLYPLVIERLRTHPHEAKFVNESEDYVTDLYGYTALHFACLNSAPPYVILALIEAWPEATEMVDHMGLTPLNYAACHDSNAEVIEAILKVNFSMVNKDCNKTILKDFSLFHSFAIRTSIAETSGKFNLPSIDHKRMFQKFNLLVKAMCHGAVSDILPSNEKWLLLHSCLSLPACPLMLLRLALKAHPEQLSERDRNGNLPIHVAITNPSLRRGEEANIFQDLIDACPTTAGAVDGEGRLPLKLAVENEQEWVRCIKPLLEANPDVLSNTNTGKLCFLLKANNAEQSPYGGVCVSPEVIGLLKERKQNVLSNECMLAAGLPGSKSRCSQKPLKKRKKN